MATTETYHNRPGPVLDALTALSMTIGRGRAARLAADLTEFGAGDRVVDIGCGPGTAARGAARRGASATGVDPSLATLRLGRRITWLAGVSGATSSREPPKRCHSPTRAPTSSRRSARCITGPTMQGLTTEDAAELAQTIEAAAFLDVERQIRHAGRRTLVVITATTPLTSTRDR